MPHLLLLLGILGGAIPLAAQPAFAEQPAPSAPSAAPATAAFEDQLVVTASLDATPERELPASVEVFTAEDIETRQATTVYDLLRTVPGVAVVRSGGPGDVTSLFLRGAGSAQSLVLWNGLPLNDPYFGGFDWASLTTDGAERVEVVRGPLSTLYGSDAVGGVVQVITGRQTGTRLRLEAGERGYGRVALTAGLPLGDGHLDLIGSHENQDGLRENDDFRSTGIIARIGWQPVEGLDLSLLGRSQDSDLGIPASGGIATPERRQASRSLEVALPWSLVRGSWQLDGQLAETHARFRFRDPEADFALNDTDTERRRLRAVVTRDLGAAGWIAAGGEWHRETVSNVTTFGVNLDDDSQSSWAGFVELHRTWQRWTLQGALRRDDNEFFGSEWSPALGASVRLGTSTRWRVSYGEGFRAPSLGELFFPFSGNPQLAPETSRSVETGLEQRAGAWRFDVAVFDQRLVDLIQFDPQTFVNENVGEARIRGAEAVVEWGRRRFRARLTATHLDTEDRATGEGLLRRPRQSAGLVLTWQPAAWTVELLGRYTGDRQDLDPVTFARSTNPAYTVADLTLRWNARRWQPYGRVLNLADETYEEALGFPAPGRTVVAGVSFAF
ncbi:MAG: TonB-dependent receptor [Acidobacteria bacterium]|nr:TonB-dependent receptor [Acidobacteriota bacterium]